MSLHGSRTMTGDLTVGGGWLRLLLDALRGAGFDGDAVFRRKGWDVDGLVEPEARAPWTHVLALWGAAARSSGDPHLGLHAAAGLPARAESPFGYLLMTSPTLLHGLQLMVRFQELHFDGRAMSLEDRGDHFAVILSLPRVPAYTFHQIEYVSVLLKRAFAWVVGPPFRLVGARFSHDGPVGAAEHERIFECPVAFGERENALLVSRETAVRSSLFASAEALETVVAVAEGRLARLRSPAWARRVRVAVDSSPALDCDIGRIARHLGISGRSLQRKLAAEGTRFSKVLDESRRDRSLQIIRRPGVTAYLKFDFSTLPPVSGAEIRKATLTLFLSEVGAGGSFLVRQIVDPWDELTVTAANRPTTASIGMPAIPVGLGDQNSFVTIDVTPMVQGWMDNPSSNFGLALVSAGNTSVCL